MSYRDVVLAKGPAAYYRLPGTGLEVVAGRNGVPHGVISPTPGLLVRDTDQAALLGAGGYFDLPTAAFPAYPGSGGFALTLEAWFRTAATTAVGIFGHNAAGAVVGGGSPGGWVPMMYVGADGLPRTQLIWHNAVNPLTGPRSLLDNARHHFVATIGASFERQIVDGVVTVQRAALGQFSYAGSYDYHLGVAYVSAGWPSGGVGWQFLNGVLDEVAIYWRELSPTEVLENFRAGAESRFPDALAVASRSGEIVLRGTDHDPL